MIKLRLLEARLRWHRGRVHHAREMLAQGKIEGNRAHAHKDQKAIEAARAKILHWKGVTDGEELEVHRLEVAIGRLRPKKQEWLMGGWVRPGEQCWKQRDDQGNDFELLLHHSVVAPAPGHCVEWASDRPWPGGFGNPYAVVHIDSGPFGGNSWFLGHANEPLVRPGERFSTGHPLARVVHQMNPGRGWIELGHWPPGSMSEGSRMAHLFGPVWR